MIIKQIPNLITVSRLLLLPLLIFFLWDGNYTYGHYALIVFIVIGLGDLVDGYLARKLNAESNTGKILDPMVDKMALLVCIIMFLYLGRLNPIIAMLILSREIIVITLRAVAAGEGIVIHASNEAKRKTALQNFGLACLMVYPIFLGCDMAYCGNFLLILSIIASWYSLTIYLINFIPHWKQKMSKDDQ